MDDSDIAISRVLVLGTETALRQNVLNSLFKLCGQEASSDTTQGVHALALKTKYYTADLELHVHEVKANELQTPLVCDADQYEALVWIVEASNDRSFDETEQFVSNSIEELEFNVSLIVGARAASASLVQLRRLEDWARTNGFEFVPIEEEEEKSLKDDDPLHEKRGIDRVKEALECNMWSSLKTLVKPTSTGASATMPVNQSSVKTEAEVESANDEQDVPASKILVLGADIGEQHTVVQALVDLLGGDKIEIVGEAVQELKLKTKYHEADVELHLHRVEANEIVTALQHDIDAYEALVWVVDASSEVSFKGVQQFVERSVEELTFEVSLVVGTHVDSASTKQVDGLESWCQNNGFEYVSVPVTASSSDHEGKVGFDRVLEALECNMWRSMKMLPRVTELAVLPPAPSANTQSEDPVPTSALANASSPPPAPIVVPEALSHEAQLQASIGALAGGGFGGDDDPDMEMFTGLLSQVQRIRESGALLSDEERRQQAERVAMQLWSLLGADDDEGEESD